MLALVIALWSSASQAQNIAWTGPPESPVTPIFPTTGTFLDALILNTAAGGDLTADGDRFQCGGQRGRRGLWRRNHHLHRQRFEQLQLVGSFPVGPLASSGFAAVMDAGGIYQNGGSGSGTVTLSAV